MARRLDQIIEAEASKLRSKLKKDLEKLPLRMRLEVMLEMSEGGQDTRPFTIMMEWAWGQAKRSEKYFQQLMHLIFPADGPHTSAKGSFAYQTMRVLDEKDVESLVWKMLAVTFWPESLHLGRELAGELITHEDIRVKHHAFWGLLDQFYELARDEDLEIGCYEDDFPCEYPRPKEAVEKIRGYLNDWTGLAPEEPKLWAGLVAICAKITRGREAAERLPPIPRVSWQGGGY